MKSYMVQKNVSLNRSPNIFNQLQKTSCNDSKCDMEHDHPTQIDQHKLFRSELQLAEVSYNLPQNKGG